jgi:hypothetical protein
LAFPDFNGFVKQKLDLSVDAAQIIVSPFSKFVEKAFGNTQWKSFFGLGIRHRLIHIAASPATVSIEMIHLVSWIEGKKTGGLLFPPVFQV